MADEIELLRLFRDEMPGPSTDAWARAAAAVAAARAEEERAGRRRWPPPQLVLAAGVAAVAAVVGGLLAVVAPGSPPRSPGIAGGQEAREAAFVVSRVRHALASPAKDSKFGYSRTVFPHGATVTVAPAGGWSIRAGTGASIGSVTARWYRGTATMSAFTVAGQRALAVRTTTFAGGRAVTLVVDYGGATWWRAASRVPPAASARPPGCGGPGVDIGPGGWPAFIGYQLGCGGYTAVGRQRVNGVSAIKLTGSHSRNTLWVDPATYLPVRSVLGGQQQIRTDFRWLAPDRVRPAALSLPVPVGFRQVPPP